MVFFLAFNQFNEAIRLRKRIFFVTLILLIFGTVMILFMPDKNENVEKIVLVSFHENRGPLDKIAKSIIQNKDNTIITKDFYDESNPDLHNLFAAGFLGIHPIENKYIYFIRYAHWGFSQSLVYSKNGDKPQSPYFTEVNKLSSHWFLAKTKQ